MQPKAPSLQGENKAVKQPDLYLLVRTFQDTPFVAVWLNHRHATSGSSGLLWGELLPDVAEVLAQALGLPVEREEVPYSVSPMPVMGCASVAEQKSLFAEAK
jgi:hypothetical protein